MADRKVYAKLEVGIVFRVDEGIEISDVLNELEYHFSDTTGQATVEDTEIRDFEIEDSK